MNKILSVHNKIVVDSWDSKKLCLHPSGLGIAISFPRANNHVDMDPSVFIPILLCHIIHIYASTMFLCNYHMLFLFSMTKSTGLFSFFSLSDQVLPFYRGVNCHH